MGLCEGSLNEGLGEVLVAKGIENREYSQTEFLQPTT
jgi:hypothetical protein